MHNIIFYIYSIICDIICLGKSCVNKFLLSRRGSKQKIGSNGSSMHRIMKSDTCQRIGRNKVIDMGSCKAAYFE